MPESSAIRRLSAKWDSNAGWPKRIEWLKIDKLRGWQGQQLKLTYPIMALVGENGSGKSTVLQSAAAIYKNSAPKKLYKGRGYASDYFPRTVWDSLKGVEITYCLKEGDRQFTDVVRRPGDRWRGNIKRRERSVVYIDLSRIQPVPARTGYWKIATSPHKEVSAAAFDKTRLERFSEIMGRGYENARMAVTDVDPSRPVPVLGMGGIFYSGFHTGAGETMIAELLQGDWPKYSLVLIDELETSLHPRAQRRLVRDLAERCRELELQIILTTHSPFVLQELPPKARAYIMDARDGRQILPGVSPEFAMTKMDEIPQYQCDLYVEDRRSQMMLTEILATHARPEVTLACQITTCGAASTVQALGMMVDQQRFRRPSRVFLDGDQADAVGCVRLPGDDAPEIVVFQQLRDKLQWRGVAERVGRQHAQVADACFNAMLLHNTHDWINTAATSLILSGDTLWQALCGVWAKGCLTVDEAKKIIQPIEDALINVPLISGPRLPLPVPVASGPTDSSGHSLLFEL